MRAIIVSVDYDDLLSITLPYNKQHFSEVWVVTKPGLKDAETARANGARVYETDAFTRNGATFNKWLALEEGYDAMGREGWLCNLDADVVWPGNVRWDENGRWLDCHIGDSGQLMTLLAGQLCSPLRRMWNSWPEWPYGIPGPGPSGLPRERDWNLLPAHRNVLEWVGYSQIFHASDPVLGAPPWHDVDFRHAGAADSFFQRKWPWERKLRPPYEVLHLGQAGANWYGRATARADGTVPEDAVEKQEKMAALWSRRRERKAKGLDPFAPERLGG